MKMLSQRQAYGLRNPWLLGILGFIALAFAVNGLFIYLSMQYKPAFVDQHANSKSRKGQEITHRELQAHQSLAWQLTVRQPKELSVNELGHYQVVVQNREGRPVTGGTMSVKALRIADEKQDFLIPFHEVGVGIYEGDIRFPLKGYWELSFNIVQGDAGFSVTGDKVFVNATSGKPLATN